MLSTVTYALSKKYTDKAVEAAADVAVDKAVDAAKEAVSQDMSEFSGRLDTLERDVDYDFRKLYQDKGKDEDYLNTSVTYFSNRVKGLEDIKQYIDEERDPSNEWDGEKYTFNRNNVLTRIDAENYKCKIYRGLEFYKNEWVFDVYCKNKNEPVAILCPWTTGITSTPSYDECKVIYADKAGPVDKTILLSRLVAEYPVFGSHRDGAACPCTIILNSYQSEPVLYNHKFSEINTYTKAETDAAIEAASQDMSEFSERLDTVEEGVERNSDAIDKKQWYVDAHFAYLDNRIGGLRDLNQYTDKERSASTTFSGKKFIFNDGVLIQVADENYQCKMYYNLEFFLSNEWVFDAYCNDVKVPVAIVCKYGSNGVDYEHCEVLYAAEVGPIDKSIILSRGASGPFDTNRCMVILNSYQSEPVLYSHEFSGINIYTKDETDAAIENVSQSMDALSQDVNELSEQLDTVKADMSIIDKKTDASNSWSGKRCGFSNDKLALIDDENYQCKLYYGYDIADNEWVFDAYCNDVNIPVAILCRQDIGDLQDLCIPIYATKVGPVNKTISITQESTGFPNDWGTIIVNSYQSEPTLYQHRLDVYTREGTDAAIANAINSAITGVINTAY